MFTLEFNHRWIDQLGRRQSGCPLVHVQYNSGGQAAGHKVDGYKDNVDTENQRTFSTATAITTIATAGTTTAGEKIVDVDSGRYFFQREKNVDEKNDTEDGRHDPKGKDEDERRDDNLIPRSFIANGNVLRVK